MKTHQPPGPSGSAQSEREAIARLLDAAKGLSFGAYPAHGSGFVCVVEGDLEAFRDAIAAADQTLFPLPAPEPSGDSAQSQTCGEASADAEVFAGLDAEPSARRISKALEALVSAARDIPTTQAPEDFWAALKAAREALSEPDMSWDYLWLPHDPESGYTEVSEAADGMDLGPRDGPAKIWRGVQLPDLWIAPLALSLDDDGDVDDWEFELFPTEAAARAAQSAAAKALSLSPPPTSDRQGRGEGESQ